MLNLNFLLPLLGSLLLTSSIPCKGVWKPSETSIVQLDGLIEGLRQSGVVDTDQTLYVVGGSANSLLMHVITNTPIKMRDFDVSFIDSEISEHRARALSQRLEALRLSDEKLVEPKTWAAGWGIFHNVKNNPLILDLIIYREPEGLFDAGGILDIEKVKIEIPPGKRLADVVDELRAEWVRALDLKSLVQLPLITEGQGFLSWINKEPHIVRIEEVRRTPLVATMRIVRNFSKLGVSLSASESRLLTDSLSAAKVQPASQKIVRQFSYLFADPTFAEQLMLLTSLGFFRHLFPSLENFFHEKDRAQLTAFFEIKSPFTDSSPEDIITQRLRKLLPFLDSADRLLYETKMAEFYGMQFSQDGSIRCAKVFVR